LCVLCFVLFCILFCVFCVLYCCVYCFFPHVYCLFSIRVQFYRPLPPAVTPITVNKFHIISTVRFLQYTCNILTQLWVGVEGKVQLSLCKPWRVTGYHAFLTRVESSWNVMAHGDAREGKWRGCWRMEWVASTLHTTSELGVSSITTADAHISAANSRLNWRPTPISMDSSVSPKDEIWFPRLCHHISNAVYWLGNGRGGGWLRSPATLTSGKEPQVLLNWGLGGPPGASLYALEKRKTCNT
jgi:hypothetical protein